MAGLDAKHSVTSGLCLVIFSFALLLLPLSTSAQAPSITGTFPGVNEQPVSDSTDIILFFNTTMDAATINDSTFIVCGRSSGRMQGTIATSDLPSLASFKPHGRFAAGEVVTVTLTKNVTSATGDSLQNGYSFSYTVGVSDSSRIIVFDSTYTLEWGPGKVVTGDFNRDGNLDFATNFGEPNEVAVFLNTGGGDFAAPMVYEVGDTPHGLTAADLDSDGDLDLTTANHYSGDISCLLNNGDGTFADQYTYYTTGKPNDLIATDLNGDGAVELVVTHGDVNVIVVIVNSGDGTFASHQFYAVSDLPASVISADFDGDGDNDVATANLNSDSISVLYNDGAAGLDSQVVFAVGDMPSRVYAADLDADGHLDLATTNPGSGDVSVLLNDGAGGFASHVTYAVGDGPWGGVVSDIDGDGALDIVTANETSKDIAILTNNGDGSFAPALTIPTGIENWQVAAGDLDGDQSLDLILPHRYIFARGITILKQRAQPSVLSITPSRNELNVEASTNIIVTFDDYSLDWSAITDSTFVVNGSYTGLHTGSIAYDSTTRTATFDPDVDFDDGEVVSVALTGEIGSSQGRNLKSHVSSFTVATGLTTGDFAVSGSYPVSGPGRISTGDLDGDGDLDLAADKYTSDEVAVFKNNGDGTLVLDSTITVGDSPYGVLIADLNGDGDMDLAVTNIVSCDISVFLNNGGGSLGTQQRYPIGDGTFPRSMAAADMDGDGDLDLITGGASDDVWLLPNNGDGTFGTVSNSATGGNQPWSIFVGDLDGDGDMDLAATNSASDNLSVLKNNGFGDLVLDSIYAVGEYPMEVSGSDFDGDGDIDLATANYETSDISVLINNGDGSFENQVSYVIVDNPGNGPRAIYASDLDGNGCVDLLPVYYSFDNVSILWGNGDGTFYSDYVFYSVGNGPISALVADFNNDGGMDIATADHLGSSITVLLNVDFPHATAHTPAQNDLNVPVTDNIVVTFDSEMDETTIIDSTFVVNGRSTGRHTGVLSYDNPTQTATFNSSEDFAEGEEVTVVLTPEMYSALGNKVQDHHAWSFTAATGSGGTGIFGLDSSYFFGDPMATGDCPFAADFNGDGALDIAVSYTTGVAIAFNDGTGIFTYDSTYAYGLGYWSSCPVGADFDGDSDIDVAAVYKDANQVAILDNLGSGTFVHDSVYLVGIGPTYAVVSDFNGDGHPDIASANCFSNDVSVLLNLGDGVFAPQAAYTVGNYPLEVMAGDFDGDGDMDLASANYYGSSVSILLNAGDGSFADKIDYPTGGQSHAGIVADFDADGSLDIATSCMDKDSVSVLLNNGDGTFGAPVLYALSPGEFDSYIFAGDLDGDGDIDLITDGQRNFSVLPNNGDGTFAPPLAYHADDMGIAGVFAADFDGDGHLDLSTGIKGGVAVLLNHTYPEILSPTTATARAESLFVWVVNCSLQRGYEATVTYLDYPGWLSADADSIFGTPSQTSNDTGFVVVVSDGLLADTMAVTLTVLTEAALSWTNNPSAQPNSGPCSLFVVADGTPEQVNLHYRVGGEVVWNSVTMAASGANYVGVLPVSAIDMRSIEYYFESSSNDFTATLPVANPSENPFSLGLELSNQQGPVLPDKVWRMIGFPFEIAPADITSVFEDELGAQTGNNWRVGHWDPTTESYLNNDDVGTIVRKNGYWLWSDRFGSVGASGVSALPDTTIGSDKYGTLVLDTGWNQISTPFGFSISWLGRLYEAGIQPWAWEYVSGIGSQTTYDTAAILEPFVGYWIKNESGSAKTLLLPYLRSGAVLKASPKPNRPTRNNWQVAIKLECESIADITNIAGVRPGACDSYDQFDFDEPPLFDKYVSLAFRQTSDGKDYRLLAGDFRNAQSSGKIFDVIVRGNSDEPAFISLAESPLIPTDYLVVLEDQFTERSYMLRPKQKVALPRVPSVDGHDYRLIVGTRKFLNGLELDIVTMPTRFELSQNYPNPFNPSTTIRFALPVPQRVLINVVNILGQRVTTLIDDDMPAGNNQVTWDGTDDFGRQVASGVYFYRLRTDKFQNNKKMVLLK